MKVTELQEGRVSINEWSNLLYRWYLQCGIWHLHTVRTKCSDPSIRTKSMIVVLCMSYDSRFGSSATVRKVAESSIF